MTSFCKHCGVYANNLKACTACYEVSYCGVAHQKADWSKHKHRCNHVRECAQSVWIEIPCNEGNGFNAKMKTHILNDKECGLDLCSKKLAGAMSPGLRSSFAELLGWNIEIFCSSRANRIELDSNNAWVDGLKYRGMNAAGIFLGCSLSTGRSKYTDMDGTIFVTGRNKAGDVLTTNVLWGILNFISDSMDYYDGTLDTHPAPTLKHWARQYKDKVWVPAGVTGIDVYCIDPKKCFRNKVVDHLID